MKATDLMVGDYIQVQPSGMLIIEDKLINMKEVTDELDEKIRTIEEGWKMECEQQKEETERARKALDNCQRARIELELEVSRLEHRNWWQRLINK